MNPDFLSSCPIPLQQYPHILMAHGGGGRLMHQLIEEMFLPAFGTHPHWQHDAACLKLPHGRIAFTTDSYVVSPLFFPGGNIGSMAVYGTVNDLSMSGAKPLYLSLSFILEEGLPMATLWRVVQSIQAAATHAGIKIVTGDTKVVERGKGDGLYLNTSGIGIMEHPWNIHPKAVQPGDAILLSGDLGRHGIAIMAQREGLAFETTLESDLAPVSDQVQALLGAGIEIHCLRDLTRGGLATALNEIAIAAHVTIELEEQYIPVSEEVQGACEILGLDPLYIANEGCFVAFIPANAVTAALTLLGSHAPQTKSDLSAQKIGFVQKSSPNQNSSFAQGVVKLNSLIGGSRILDYKSGEQLPRIC
ncbi:hydrogenase expression/formation protein HypE [Merismopedia glauca]|uniref:Hydrogenase expression/formation protein HypE n=1 Tax=Merismopedia glauca CCAP 1448/3 TaxID=1296344 RepID=A0A2T1C2R1_9CYAN|nr:hydrogenase expression/formation protein HypE [Merismopedia glauca]PSB02551.1 hydrogenase expression/formation protein HypE [Merismopedia glauca CCAP 1448/3]